MNNKYKTFVESIPVNQKHKVIVESAVHNYSQFNHDGIKNKHYISFLENKVVDSDSALLVEAIIRGYSVTHPEILTEGLWDTIKSKFSKKSVPSTTENNTNNTEISNNNKYSVDDIFKYFSNAINEISTRLDNDNARSDNDAAVEAGMVYTMIKSKSIQRVADRYRYYARTQSIELDKTLDTILEVISNSFYDLVTTSEYKQKVESLANSTDDRKPILMNWIKKIIKSLIENTLTAPSLEGSGAQLFIKVKPDQKLLSVKKSVAKATTGATSPTPVAKKSVAKATTGATSPVRKSVT